MATSSIYFNREGTTRLDIGNITNIQYAKVTLEINSTVIHASEALQKGQDYYDWTISKAEKALIMSLLPKTSKSVKGKMKVDVTWSPTGWDAPLFSENYEISFILEETLETKPSLTFVSSSPTDFADYVQGKTKLLYTVKAEAKNGASLNNPTASVNGRSCSVLNSDGNGNYTLQSNWLISSGTNRISVTIRDSRGFSQTITDEIYVHPYIPPSLSSLASELGVTCRRWNTTANIIDDMYGTACRVAVGVGVTYISGIQTGYTLTYRYRERGTTEWSEYLPVGSSYQRNINETGVHTFEGYITETPFSTEYEYDIELIVTDDLGEKSPARYEQLRSLSTSFNINDNGDVVSVGKYASQEKSRLFDSAWDIHSDESIDATKDVKVGGSLVLKDVAVTASAEELNFNKGNKDNLQYQIDALSRQISLLQDDLDALIADISDEQGDHQQTFYTKTQIDDDIIGNLGTHREGGLILGETVRNTVEYVIEEIKDRLDALEK